MDNKNTFFEPRMIVAILVTTAFFFWWQSHLAQKYPTEKQTAAPDIAVQPETAPSKSTPPAITARTPEVLPKASAEEKALSFQFSNLSFDVSSKGMGLKNIQLNEYKDRKGQNIFLGSDVAPYNLQTALSETEILDFELKKVSDTEAVGLARSGTTTIEKRLLINNAQHTILATVTTKNVSGPAAGILTYITQGNSNTAEEKGLAEKISFLSPQMDQDEVFLLHSEKKADRNFSTPEHPYSIDVSQVQIAAVSSLFFSTALINETRGFTEAKARFDEARKKPWVLVSSKPESGDSQFTATYRIFVGPKALGLLKGVDPRLKELVNFGFFSWLAELLMQLMKFFYSLVHNYGAAIILMTLVVRIAVLPANLLSYKSMAGMQKIRPEMERIKEKHKEDPAKQQQATMELFKREKINPLGGCLPALIQIPIFVALYQLLGNSIELYKAPFTLWLHDLSAKDPYFVLPISMGVALYLQQKLTPSTLDPAQQKIMNFIPIIFTLPMLALPSGLSLYWFTSTLFGIAQQLYFLKKYQPITPPGRAVVAK